MMMPVMDGFQFRAEQQRDPALAKIPVVVLSAHVKFEDKLQWAAIPVFLRKPVDMETRLKICKEVSPIYHVSKGDAPTLIIHGDADTLVPLQQSELIVEKFKEAGVPVELVVKKGAGHGGMEFLPDFARIANWFDTYLKPTAATAQAAK